MGVPDKPLAKLRVVDLRKELKRRGLGTKGRKKELVERLQAAMAADAAAGAGPSGDEESSLAPAAPPPVQTTAPTPAVTVETVAQPPSAAVPSSAEAPSSAPPVLAKLATPSRKRKGSETPTAASGGDPRPQKKPRPASRRTTENKARGDGSAVSVHGASAGGIGSPKSVSGTTMCPYLDTINRKVLDFDLERVCSVTLNDFNVYSCLVCGGYYQGRGKGTQAYLHALEVDHHVFINLTSGGIYCLPDNYKVNEVSLSDIQFNLDPAFDGAALRRLDGEGEYCHALDGTDYLIGFMGLNNINKTDWFNVCAQALVHVPMLRDYFLIRSNYEDVAVAAGRKNPRARPRLVRALGAFTRKLWNPRGFKGHVSPHQMLNAVVTASGKQFNIGEKTDPIQFLAWFLNTMHMSLGGTRRRKSSIISRAFQGAVDITTDAVVRKEKRVVAPGKVEIKEEIRSETNRKPFLYLSLDLPRSPLFKDGVESNFIPQVPLFELLNKFDGKTVDTVKAGVKRRFRLAKLPRYLIVHYKRFTMNNWFKEKNPTLVNFPLYNLNMEPYLATPPRPAADELNTMTVKQLRAVMEKRKVDARGCLTRSDLVEAINSHFDKAVSGRATRYDLICNVCHDGSAKEGSYKAYVLHRGMGKWFLFEDLDIKTSETMAQQVAQSECYIQVYELQPPGKYRDKAGAEASGASAAMDVETGGTR